MRAGGSTCWVRAKSPSREERTDVSIFWIIGFVVVAVIVIGTIVDVFRRHYSTKATLGWLLLVVILPVVGALIYWGTRKPTDHEVEEKYLGEADVRRSREAQPFDRMGL
jgi:amino acid transporter